jgi:alpha-tubulin suppressor-like RCC1 family protein
MRWRFGLGIVLVVDALAFTACDTIERDEIPRYYVPPPTDAADVVSDDRIVTDAGTDAGDASDAGVDAATAPTPTILATGSGVHPDGTIGCGDHTCVIAKGDAGTGVWCWGANDRGQLGVGTTGDGTPAADVATATQLMVDETGLSFDGVDELALAPWHSCARRKDVLFCWGQRFAGAQAEPLSAIGPDRVRPRAIGNLDVASTAAGGAHTCALKSNGRHVCFGHSTFNELGRPNALDPACTAPIFYAYHGLATHSCSGDLTESAAIPGASPPKSIAVSAGEAFSCALAGDHVYCWGTNLGGQLGRPGTQTGELNPQEVVTDANLLSPLDGVTAIASGGKHSCALRQGTVHCWGTNDAGQLGVPSATTAQRPTAAAVAGIANVTSIGVAEQVSCAVRADKTVWCWGADLTSLPAGGAIVSSPTPTQIKGPGGAGVLGDVEAVAPGLRHACARKVDGTVWCWGKNDRGQLGDGTKVDSPFPVKVVGLL